MALSYTRKTYHVQFSYALRDAPLSSVDEIKDLGVYFDKTLSFCSHIKYAQSALHALGIVCRILHDDHSPVLFLKSYAAVCLPLLEYVSVDWGTTCKSNSDITACIQNKLISVFQHHFCHSGDHSPALSNVPQLTPLDSLTPHPFD